MPAKKQQPQQQPQQKKQKQDTETAAATASNATAAAFEKRIEEKQQKMTEIETKQNRVVTAVMTLLQFVTILVLIVVFGAVISAGCFTHRHPMALYFIERAAVQQGNNNNNNNNLLSWQYLGDTPSDFGAGAYAPFAHDSLLANTRFCRKIVEPYVLPPFLLWLGASTDGSAALDEQQQQQQHALYDFENEAEPAATLYRKDAVSAFVRGLFRTARRLDYFVTTTALFKSPFFNEANRFGVVGASTTDDAAAKDSGEEKKNIHDQKKQKQDDDDGFFLCRFARASSSSNNNNSSGSTQKQRAAGGSVRVASLFDFLAASELREILVPRSGTLRRAKLLQYQQFIDSRRSEDDASAVFSYLRYLYFHRGSSSAPSSLGDTTFLGEFLQGFISVPHSSGISRIRFAVPRSHVRDGITDCCDGSDEADAAAAATADDKEQHLSNNNKKKKQQLRKQCGLSMRAAVYRAQQKLFSLARGTSICHSRARHNAAELAKIAADTADKLRELEPQWQQVDAELQSRYAAILKLQQAATSPGTATPKLQQKFQQAVMEFRHFQQQVQQFHAFKTQTEQLNAAVMGPLGDSGQFLNVFERRMRIPAAQQQEAQMGKEQQQQQQQQQGAAAEDGGSNNNNNNGDKIEKVPFCVDVTMDPKRLAGGSAEPVFTVQRLSVCPFRGVNAASEEQMKEFETQQQQQQQQQQEPERTLLGRYVGNVGYWPAFAVAGRRTFMDVLPQMPGRMARARIAAAKREYKSVALQTMQQKQRSPGPQEIRLLQQGTAQDAAEVFSGLSNRSVTAVMEKHEQEKGEFVAKRKAEVEAAAAAATTQDDSSAGQPSQEQQQQQQQQQPTIDFDAEAVAAEFPAFQANADTVENRWGEVHLGNWSRFLRESSIVVAQPHIYRFGQSCWKGPTERVLVLFFACGDRDRVLDFREDGKCVYEVVMETPSACCSGSLEKSVNRGNSSSDLFESALFATQMPQADNTLVRRYSAVETLLATWIKYL